MKIFAVRIGDKYGPEYETYLEDKLSDYELVWIREPYHPEVKLQWNKMWAMQTGIDEPVCVMDIDVVLINDFKKIFDWPIERGEFAAMPGWWRDTDREGYKINGGFFKYYPTDCEYIYEKFMRDYKHWQSYYILNNTTTGPVNGEQYFVEDSVKEKLKLTVLPPQWFTRWVTGEDIIYGKSMMKFNVQLTRKYREITGNDYIFLGDEFHSDIKFVHFSHRFNKPHEWEGFKNHV